MNTKKDLVDANIIRLKFNPELTPAFKTDLIQAIQKAIKLIQDKHYGGTHTDAEVEVAMGELYTVKRKLEGDEKV